LPLIMLMTLIFTDPARSISVVKAKPRSLDH
jgi:hypothetical protein